MITASDVKSLATGGEKEIIKMLEALPIQNMRTHVELWLKLDREELERSREARS
jgi:hypothetical protein